MFKGLKSKRGEILNRRKIVGMVSLLVLVGLAIPSGVKASQGLNYKNINLLATPTSAKVQKVKHSSNNKGESSDVNSAQTTELSKSKISFYDESSKLISAITFDTNAMKFRVQNNATSFDSSNQNFLEIGLYSSSEKKIINPTQVSSSETSDLSKLLNGKSFAYGDIISLTYNNNISIPVISNGDSVIGNIIGNIEYFKITREGLERVNLSNTSNQKANLAKVQLNSAAQIANYLKQETDIVNKAINSNSINGAVSNVNVVKASTVCAFINSLGLENIQNFYGESTSNANFIKWVLSNNEAMSLWLRGNTNGASMNALGVWEDIWSTYDNSHNGFNLKLSIAVALTNQTPIIDVFSGNSIGNPVQRYQIFESLNAEGGMYRYFNSFGVRLLKSVVDVPIENSEILKFRGMLLNKYNNLVNSVGLSSINSIPNYSVKQNSRIIGNIVSGPNGFENISGIASIACRVFGQPVHEVENPKYNDYGVYTDLYSNTDRDSLKTSNEYLWIANTLTSNSLKLDAINQAIQTEPLNIMAWDAKINLLKASKSTTASDYLTLSTKIMDSLKNHPTVVVSLLSEFNKNLEAVASVEQYSNFTSNVQLFLENARATENILGLGLSDINASYMRDKGFVLNSVKSYGEIDINAWNQARPVASMNFEKSNILNVNGQHAYIGTSANDGIGIKVYDSNMNLLNQMNVSGNKFGNESFRNTLNNYKFNVGDIVMIEYNPGQYSNGYLTMVNQNLKTSKLSNDVVIQITKNGIKTLNNYKTTNGKIYTFNTGFVTTQKGKEYLVNGIAKKGLQVIDNNTYYFNNEGIMQTGVKTIEGQKYYFNNQGIMQTGWVTVNNNREYFEELPYDFEMARNNIENALGNAQSINLVAYTPKSVDVLSRAVNEGENLMGNQAVTVAEMQKATDDINNALDGLKAQKTPLKNAISKADAVNLIKYTPTSVNTLSSAVNKGLVILNSSNYTLAQIDNTTNAILNGIKTLQVNNDSNTKLAA